MVVQSLVIMCNPQTSTQCANSSEVQGLCWIVVRPLTSGAVTCGRCVCACIHVCVCVSVCACVRVWWSCLSVLARGWLYYTTSGHSEESCFSPAVTGHPLTCACSVGWAFTLSSLTVS